MNLPEFIKYIEKYGREMATPSMFQEAINQAEDQKEFIDAMLEVKGSITVVAGQVWTEGGSGLKIPGYDPVEDEL